MSNNLDTNHPCVEVIELYSNKGIKGDHSEIANIPSRYFKIALLRIHWINVNQI